MVRKGINLLLIMNPFHLILQELKVWPKGKKKIFYKIVLF